MAVKTNLKNITTANGYNTNIGARVYIAKMFWDISELPAIIMMPMADIMTGSERSYRRDNLSFDIQLKAGIIYTYNSSRETLTGNIFDAGEKVLADIRKGMGQSLSNIDDCIYTSGGVDEMPELRDGDLAVIVTALYTIRYSTLANNPYSKG